MSSETVGLLGVGLFLVLIATGMPIALAGALTGFLGVWYLAGLSPALGALGVIPYAEAASYSFTVLPLFIIMGYFAFHAGLAAKAFDAGKRLMGHLPGGLALATVTAGAAIAACCGMSTASAAITGKLAIDEMEKLHYKPRLITGVVAASGTLATMIPPSATLVVYAIMTEVSVGKCLIAGVLPGLINAFLYGIMLYVRAMKDPSLTGDLIAPHPWSDRLRSLPKLWGVGVIIAVIIGGIYTGLFTPTEAASIAALVAFLLFLSARKRADRWKTFQLTLLDTARATGMIFLVMVGIVIFSRFQAMSRLPYSFVEWFSSLGLNRYAFILLILLFYLLLGMFLETMGMLLLSIPVTYPLVLSMGFDPIWFGVFVVKTIEVGMLTPPVGLNVYVIRSLYPQYKLEEIFLGALPFLLADFAVLALLIIFPEIALFLPSKMKA